VAAYQLTTIASIITRLGQRTDGMDTNVFWVEQEKLDAINEALRVWQCLVGQFEQLFKQSASPAQTNSFFPVPRQFASITRVLYNGNQLTLLSLNELDNGYPDWVNTQGTPLYWAPVGASNIALYPYPVGGELTFYGYRDLLKLGPMDYIIIGNEELTRVLEYAEHYLSFKEGMTEMQASSDALDKMAAAAAYKNGRIKQTEYFKHYAGLDRENTQRPMAAEQGVGIR
jgi:hypothetical protein